MANRNAQRSTLPWRPPPDVPEADGPVDLPADDYDWIGVLSQDAFDGGASYRRFTWACAAVGALVMRRMEADRLLTDDRPEAIIATVRRWCLRLAPDEALREAVAEAEVAEFASRSGSPERWRYALQSLSGLLADAWLRWDGRRSPRTNTDLANAAIYAAAAISETGRSDEGAMCEVLGEFRRALGEPMRERVDNPGRVAGAETITIRVTVPPSDDDPDSDDPPDMRVAVVSAFNAAGVEIGGIDVEPACSVIEECLADFEAIESLRGVWRSAPAPYVVWGSAIGDAYRGRGLGVELYATAVWFVTKRLGGALIAHHCGGYETSEAARRVWASARFRERVTVRGMVAAWTSKRQLRVVRSVQLPPSTRKPRR